jgi:hypothetical protein
MTDSKLVVTEFSLIALPEPGSGGILDACRLGTSWRHCPSNQTAA